MRLLTFTTLYPNGAQPQHGVFVEQRLRQLVGTGKVTATVLAPVPWFPSSKPMFGPYARFAGAPRRETRHGVTVFHPRYVVIPKIGINAAPSLLARGSKACFEALRKEHGFDVVDAHYFYPDGVAAAKLTRASGLPLIVTARGSDINVIAQFPRARKMILWAADQAAAVVAVSAALQAQMVRIGIPEDRIHVLRNGVDTSFFHRLPREETRLGLGVRATTLLSVGKLVEGKGHDLVVRALKSLPDAHLVIVGAGPMRRALENLVADLDLRGRVRFAGEVSHEALREYYSAADVLVLASAREGMPNVVLESLACGTPVVATDVGGTAEIITHPEAGRLLKDRSSAAIAEGVRSLLERPPSPSDVRRHAEQFTWAKTTAELLALIGEVSAVKLDTRRRA